jgi:hypothetical protein
MAAWSCSTLPQKVGASGCLLILVAGVSTALKLSLNIFVWIWS